MKIDENGHDTASLIRGWQLGCTDAVALKLSKFCGLGSMRRARDLRLDSSMPTRDGGYITPSTAPGIGVNPDLDLLGAPVLELSA